MTPPPDNGDPDVEAPFRALAFLHSLSPDFGGVDLSDLPGYGDFTLDSALQAVTRASGEEIPISARLAVLYDLSRPGAPGSGFQNEGYQQLADSALALKPGHAPGLGVETLLGDLQTAARSGVPFNTMSSANAFEHYETAFIGEGVCTIRQVKVGGVPANWVYSEFETDAPFERVADWVEPRTWPKWGPLLFRRMDLLLSPPAPVDISPPPPGDQHWHGLFHEEVRLVKLVNTVLRCSYWRSSAAAGMTYDLDLSLDGQIDVDRGFLLVTELGTSRRVQVLKIVSFTDDRWDRVAALVCPFWTDWIRGAVEGGSTSAPTPPTHTPPADPSSCVATMDAWTTFLGNAARPYVDLGSSVTSRIRSREYSTPDLLADSTRVWSQLAKDWAQAWTAWTETVDEVAREGLDAGFTPPGVPREVGRRPAMAPAGATAASGPAAPAEVGGTVVLVPGLTEGDRPRSTELVSIDVGTATIPATDVAVTVRRLTDGRIAAQVQTTNTAVPAGLYVGRLDGGDGRALAPIHLYVSRATGA